MPKLFPTHNFLLNYDPNTNAMLILFKVIKNVSQ